MDDTTVEEQKLDLERERLSFEREKLEFEKDRLKKSQSRFQKHFGAILAALVPLVAALITAAQIVTAYITKSREIAVAELRREAETERLWRLALLEFLERHETSFFSDSEKERKKVIVLLDLTFPPKYADPVRNPLTVATAKIREPEGLVRERVLEDLLNPVIVELDKTKRALKQWMSTRIYRFVKEIYEGNLAVRDLLITKADLIPPELRPDAVRLVAHYDAWLEGFERARGAKEPDEDQPFEFIGVPGYPFPTDAERHFRETYSKYLEEVPSQ